MQNEHENEMTTREWEFNSIEGIGQIYSAIGHFTSECWSKNYRPSDFSWKLIEF